MSDDRQECPQCDGGRALEGDKSNCGLCFGAGTCTKAEASAWHDWRRGQKAGAEIADALVAQAPACSTCGGILGNAVCLTCVHRDCPEGAPSETLKYAQAIGYRSGYGQARADALVLVTETLAFVLRSDAPDRVEQEKALRHVLAVLRARLKAH